MPKDKKAASDDLYQRLGVPKDADEGQIKKAYRMLALKHHPDKGGDAEVFKTYAEAYAVLSDPEKRRIYDSTGDAQLTIAQRVPVTAALIVTTPQEVALADVRRGVSMFTKTAVPVIGLVETMSYFQDPAGQKHFLMGHGGG